MAAMAWLHSWRRGLMRLVAIACLTLLTLVTGQPLAAAQTTSEVVPSPLGQQSFVAVAVEQVGDAVVRIDTEKNDCARNPRSLLR